MQPLVVLPEGVPKEEVLEGAEALEEPSPFSLPL
jgi:hypothetical protein